MTPETKNCQNCKKDFTIEPDDFAFYEKMKVPAPTFCSECRMQRRFAFRNEWKLYQRKCDLCKKSIIAMYPANTTFPVYCHDCWYSDKWDAKDYGMEYNFSQPFLSQFKELINAVPRLNLFQRNSINSPFTNMVGESKNVYLSCSVIDGSENVFYSKFIDKSFNIIDSFSTTNSDMCYENTHVDRNYSSSFAVLSRNCIDCRFIYDCINCKNCILSANLRNRQFVIRNKSYSKEEYFNEIEKMNFDSYKATEEYKKEFSALKQKAIHKFADITKSPGSTGNHITNSKNAEHCFETHDAEDAKYCFRLVGGKQLYDLDYGGINSELIYEYVTGGKNDRKVMFSVSAFEAVHDAYYTDYCSSSSYLFGCSAMRSKEYCILNKQYTKEEYEELLPKIKQHMDDMPYIDKGGRMYKYGEFFPIEFSPFPYNETLAQECFPLTKEQVIKNGFVWKDEEVKNYIPTKSISDIPDRITDIDNSIVGEIVECNHKELCDHWCTKAFKINSEEFQLYKKMNIPLPRICPSCRYFERISRIEPLKLWHRKCMKPGCPNEFETSYSPDRPEIVYCETCYNQEVA